MFQIITDNKIFYTAEKPNYVKKKISTGAWITADKESAQALTLEGEIYSLQNKPPIEGRPLAIVREVDVGTLLSNVGGNRNDELFR